MELVVVAGADAGSQFTIEGSAVLVGRGQPETGQTGFVRLRDKSISRRQAWIRRDGSGTTIESIATAANPTLVNGEPIERARLSAGDRIEMGRIAIDVRARGGLNLSGLTEIMEDAARESTWTSTSPASAEATEIREMAVTLGELRVLRGATRDIGRRFPIGMAGATIGRGESAQVRIVERGVSRLHAEIGIEGQSIVLRQRSETNPTLLNGLPVLDQVALRDGDEIALADRVTLAVQIAAGRREAPEPGAVSGSGLSRTMRQKLDVEREIETFSMMGSFLDVDVVGSRSMKPAGERPEHVILSFDRFRSFVGGVCEEHAGQVLNCNGDELMCFFEQPLDAVLAGCAILARLPAFNREQNLLGQDFRFRLGVHTGRSLVDLEAGVAYSEVLDTAGHIQKQAEPDSILISRTTLEWLPEGFPASPFGQRTPGQELQADAGEALYRVDRLVSREDLLVTLPPA